MVVISPNGHLVIYEELIKGTVTSCHRGTVCAGAELFTTARCSNLCYNQYEARIGMAAGESVNFSH